MITENQLDEWSRSNSENAKGIIVELVGRLIAASCPKPIDRRIPLSDSIGQHGPDVVLNVALGEEPFVPEGHSFWEVGTNVDAHAKATQAYGDLTAAVPEATRHKTTFIFVTPMSGRKGWEYTWKPKSQAAWLDKRRNSAQWLDVRIIDGTKMIDWLDHYPAVALWLASKTGSVPEGQLDIPSLHWSFLSSIGDPPPLSPHLFLVNRDEAIAKLREVLDETSLQLKITTHYPSHVVDFISAYLASLDESSRADADGRCLIVSSPEAWLAVCNNSHWKRHVLIADTTVDLSGDQGTKLIQKARKSGHAVVFCGPQGGIPDPTSTPLPSPLSHQIQDALKKAGYQDERARSLAQKSAGNLSALLRCIQNLSVLPAWAERSDAGELAIALLIGSWSETSPADKQIVEGMSGKAYGEWIRGMREIAASPSTPLIQRDGNWKFISRYDGWYALGSRVFNEQLDRLKEITVSILHERDPKFELPADERFAAGIHGKVLKHSKTLRSGLAESLALLGSHPKALSSCSLGKPEITANLSVKEILKDADWIQWASLNDLLPLLAEAAPETFLAAVDSALQLSPCPFDSIFAQEGDGIFGSNYLTGLLWALETLAWDADYLGRAVLCLGELASHDPGGRWANRPANSLTNIVLPWFPQTCANVSQRVAAVKMLLSENPEVGWKLLISLLPQQQSYSSGSRRPAWRDTIPEDWKDGSPRAEYWEQTFAYAELAVKHAKHEVSRLSQLIDNLENLPSPSHEQLLEYLQSDVVLSLPVEEKLILWNKLTELVTRHRKFPAARWAMPPHFLDRIAAVADGLAPDRPFHIHQRLFNDQDYGILEEVGDYKQQMETLEKRREAAISEIAKDGGLKAVIEFAGRVQSPWRVGIAFGIAAEPENDRSVLPSLLESVDDALSQFAGGFIQGRFHSGGWEWVDKVVSPAWNEVQIGKFFSFLPFDSDAWDRIQLVMGEKQTEYWVRTPANPYDADTNLERGIDQLLKYGRPYPAIRCLRRLLYDKKPINSSQAVRALREALKSSDSPNSMDSYEIAEIIKELQADLTLAPDDLFSVEWSYLPLLNGQNGVTPKLLWRKLSEEPGFFCEVIRIVFRSRKEVKRDEVIAGDRQKIATNAYRLLDEWRRPPGLREDGTLEGKALHDWLESVKTECSESGHIEMAMLMVGHVLSYAPPDPDGLWMHRSVAEVLNAKDAKHMRDGFETEIFNSRGVHTMDPTGKAEQELAAKYDQQADAVDTAGFSRLAATVRILAETYRREADRNSRHDEADEW